MRIFFTKINRFSALFLLSSLLVTCSTDTKLIATPTPTVPGTVSSQITPYPTTLAPWTDYVGISGVNPQQIPAWIRIVRDSGKVGKDQNTKESKELEQSSIAKSVNILRVTGQSASNRNDSGFVGRFLATIKSDGGKSYRSEVYNTAIKLAQAQQNGNQVYWQIGNEITKEPYAREIFKSQGNNAKSQAADTAIIPTYVETYLAPGVEALRSASQSVFQSDRKIPIVLGSIGNAYVPNRRDFLNALLAYQIRGDYAKSLAGKRVADIVDFISWHYLVTATEDSSWMSTIDQVRNQWIGKSQVQGIWTTEELGRKRGTSGRGASTTIRVASRYLHYWSQRQMTPLQGKCFFWGWNMGGEGKRGIDALQTLYTFLGNTPLQDMTSALTLTSKDDFESYLFQSKVDPSKRVVMFMPWDKSAPTQENFEDAPPDKNTPNGQNQVSKKERKQAKALTTTLSADQLPSLAVQSIKMKAEGWTSNNVSATLHLFSAKQGYSTSSVSVKKEGDSYRVLLPNSVKFIPDQTSAQLFLQQQGS